MKQARTFTVGSLFSGIGGFDLGLERAGTEVRWQVENNSFCNGVLERRWPNGTRFGDITTTKPQQLEWVDLICGGFPCQDLSVAGKRAGLAGEQSGLFFEFMRVVGEVSPTWVLVENVPGLLSSNEGRDMGTVLGTLGQLGYWWIYRVLDSQYFEVPQRRRRVFIVGHLGGPCPPEILFEPESVYGNLASSERAGQDIAGTLAADAHPSGFNGRDAERGNIIALQDDSSVVHGDKARLGVGGSGHPSVAVRRAQTSSNGWGISEDMTHTLDETGGDAILSYIPEWAQNGGEAVSDLVNTGQVRRLTPLECERLQGFPDGWTDMGSDSQRYKALGNAVTVPVAEYIGRSLLKQARTRRD